MSQIEKAAELALKLKDSDAPEVQELALAYLDLEAMYGQLKQQVTRQAAELVMRRHEKLFKNLAKHDISKPERDVTNSGGETNE